MDETLRQVGELLISSIPTIIGLLIVWTAYRFLVHGPLQRVLAERHALTQGAIEHARAEIAKAEARTAEYEQRVREARSQIYKTQEAYRQQVMEERNNALAEARKQAGETVKNARADLGKDVVAAKAVLQHQSETLADRVIARVLGTAKASAAAGGQ
jgi:F-type H+-transporting ATPase subunit b